MLRRRRPTGRGGGARGCALTSLDLGGNGVGDAGAAALAAALARNAALTDLHLDYGGIGAAGGGQAQEGTRGQKARGQRCVSGASWAFPNGHAPSGCSEGR